jgi:hypothetical protein
MEMGRIEAAAIDRGGVADIVAKALGSLAGIAPEPAARLARRYAEDADFDLSLAVDKALAFGDPRPALDLLAREAATQS